MSNGQRATITEWPPKWFLKLSAADRPLRCMVLFWLFFVLVLVLDRSIMRLYHSILVNALLRREFGNGLADGDKEHDPRVGERRFVGRSASRVDAMDARRSITITSTVRHGGLSTSTMGSCVRVGTNVWIQRAVLKKRVAENTRYRRFAAIHC